MTGMPDSENRASITPASKVLLDGGASSAAKYRKLTAGDTSFGFFVLFELFTFLLSGLPGALGLWLRKKTLPRFLGGCGQGVVVGKDCVFRHPRKIFLGSQVVIDDYCVLDARGTGESGLRIGDRTIVNRGTHIISKGGDITIGADGAIGSYSSIVSWSGVAIDEAVSMAGECLISAGTYPLDQMSLPRSERSPTSEGPIHIGSYVWIASRVTVLDGVSIGDDSVISAGSVVSGNIPPRSVAHGNPAKVVFSIRD